jgi:hypothetical protein
LPVTWHRDSRQRWIVLVYSDPYTIIDLERVTAALVLDSVFKATKRILVDATNCVPPTPEFVREMARLAERYGVEMSGTNVAVAAKDDATFGMARMAELLFETRRLPMRLSAFRHIDDAAASLSDTSERLSPDH